MTQLTDKMNAAVDQQKDTHREKIASESEFDKQKALYLQQIEHLSKNKEVADEKEKQFLKELKDMKLESHSHMGEAKQKHEQEIRDLQAKNKE